MKKLLSIVLALTLALTLVLTLAACGSETNNAVESNNDVSAVGTSNDVGNSAENNEEAPAETSTDAEWKQFLKEYEEWVDEYIEITKKYKDNPSDMSILSDYTDMMTEMAEWTSKTEKMEKELENASPAELAEYSAILAKIVAKLAEDKYLHLFRM